MQNNGSFGYSLGEAEDKISLQFLEESNNSRCKSATKYYFIWISLHTNNKWANYTTMHTAGQMYPMSKEIIAPDEIEFTL